MFFHYKSKYSWHKAAVTINFYRNVDGKSNLRIMKKKSASETSTKDPLYLGGVPKDVKVKGLDTAGQFLPEI